MNDDRTFDILFYSLFAVGGVAAVAGAYFLVKRYYPTGEVLFNGQRFPITSEDKLWAARMVIGESGGRDSQASAAVLWAILTRWVTRPVFQRMTWTQVIRAFSQVLNPIWASSDAAGCQRNPAACTPAHLERRRHISTMPWSNIPQTVRDQVEAFARGRVANPIPEYNNFAAASAGVRSSELPPMTIGGNTFIRDPGSLQGSVRIV